MPYEVVKLSKGYKVKNKNTNTYLSNKYFKTKQEAIKQMQAVQINENKIDSLVSNKGKKKLTDKEYRKIIKSNMQKKINNKIK